MNTVAGVLVGAMLLMCSAASLSAQDAKIPPPASKNLHTNPSTSRGTKEVGREYSGMYTFVEDGEFVQITVEDEGKVTGYVSRYRKGESGNEAFLDQYFRTGKLDGAKLSFTTETVQGVWYVFSGTVERGEGKNPADEGYFVLKGTLDENTSDASKKETTNSRSVVFKRFPETASTPSSQISIPAAT